MIDNESEELYLKGVVKYKEEKSPKNTAIVIGSIGTGIVALYIMNLILGLTPTAPPIASHISMLGASITSIYLLVKGLARKLGIQVSPENVNKHLVSLGLVADNDVSKSRSM